MHMDSLLGVDGNGARNLNPPIAHANPTTHTESARMHFDFIRDAMRTHSDSPRPSALLSERLRALAQNDERRSQMGRFRDVYEDVERALAAGVRQTDVIRELQAGGLAMTLAGFKSALQRVRQQRASEKGRPLKGIKASWAIPSRDEGFEFRPATTEDASNLV